MSKSKEDILLSKHSRAVTRKLVEQEQQYVTVVCLFLLIHVMLRIRINVINLMRNDFRPQPSIIPFIQVAMRTDLVSASCTCMCRSAVGAI